jgi:FKBP-type peptidyl-prolyl cis-trans isomerase
MRISIVVAVVATIGCAGSTSSVSTVPVSTPSVSTTSAAPPKSEVELVTFAPSLGINLDSMTKRPSGLYLKNLVIGTGAIATRGRSAVVRYAGYLPSGTLFEGGDASAEITVALGSNATIRGWEEGLPGMRVGGKRRLIIPPSLGYGAKGSGPIPPNSVLIFDMELIAVR